MRVGPKEVDKTIGLVHELRRPSGNRKNVTDARKSVVKSEQTSSLFVTDSKLGFLRTYAKDKRKK